MESLHGTIFSDASFRNELVSILSSFRVIVPSSQVETISVSFYCSGAGQDRGNFVTLQIFQPMTAQICNVDYCVDWYWLKGWKVTTKQWKNPNGPGFRVNDKNYLENKFFLKNISLNTFIYNYRMCAIITRSWFETALNYKPLILKLK